MAWLKVERLSDTELRAIRQEQIDKIRQGGFGKTADKAQQRLDKKLSKKGR